MFHSLIVCGANTLSTYFFALKSFVNIYCSLLIAYVIQNFKNLAQTLSLLIQLDKAWKDAQ